MSNQTIALLGSTGSVGMQTLEVARHQGWRVSALAALGSRPELLASQLREFRPAVCAVSSGELTDEIKAAAREAGSEIICGCDAASQLAAESEGVVVDAIIGYEGLKPAIAALKAGKRLALANKESLVCAGPYFMRVYNELRRSGVQCELIPVDSEHSAIFQCLDGKTAAAERIYLTCSGGPFFGKDREFLKRVTAAEALAHPTWSMGAQITIDSATLMNKGFEVIEAARLFDIPGEDIEVLIHRDSIVHSMVGFYDGAVLAQLSLPDMRLCIQYAVTYPNRIRGITGRLDFTAMKPLCFSRPDTGTFRLLDTAYSALRRGGAVPAALYGANDAAVRLFLEGRIGFTDITDSVCAVTGLPWNESDEVTPDDCGGIIAEAQAKLYEHLGI